MIAEMPYLLDEKELIGCVGSRMDISSSEVVPSRDVSCKVELIVETVGYTLHGHG